MVKYYAYCEKHGIIGTDYNNPDQAAGALTNHIRNVSRPHGKTDVIEQFVVQKYGQEIVSLRKHRK